ncbi:MAG: phosphodiester glycosidase family protein, partial [Hyphomicrobiales bacterium]
FRPLRNGLATICTGANGAIKMGTWGSTIAWEDGFTACRQNAVLLIENGEISRRVGEGNDTWGYVKVDSTEFITWRSAVGLTKDGNLVFAAGNSLSAETLAKALWAAGAYTAMQLDINNPYVLGGLFFPQGDGSLEATRFMDSMPDSPSRFLKTQARDFFYVTLDESRHQP